MVESIARSSWFTILVRIGFVGYTIALLIATHWPGLAVKSSFSRIDLVIHAFVFGGWTVLLGMSRLISIPSDRLKQMAIIAMCGIGFGVFDETTQPLFSRVFDWFDLLADATGSILAAIAMWGVLKICERSTSSTTPPPPQSQDSVGQPSSNVRSSQ